MDGIMFILTYKDSEMSTDYSLKEVIYILEFRS